MKKIYGLTNTETEIMELLWNADHKLSFREMLDYFTQVLHKDWKKQTLSSYLLNLQKAGLISADAAGKNYYYYAACTKEEHIHNWTRKLLADSFGNSLGRFMAAFSGGEKLSEKEAAELKRYLEDESGELK